MPQRSNEFQKLVYLVKKHWAGEEGVEESQILEDQITRQQREVDVCITGIIGGHEVIVSIECVDRSRKADITWVEQMKEKHSRLPTNVLVLYSSAGFSKTAIDLATIYGIETVTLEQVEEGYVSALMGRSGDMVVVKYSLEPVKVVAVVPKHENLPAERVALMPENILYYSDGSDAPMLRKVVEEFIYSEEVGEELIKSATEDHVSFVMVKPEFLDKKGEELYIEKVEPKVLRRVWGLEVSGNCTFEFTRFPLRHGRLGEIDVSWGNAELDGREALMVVSPSEGGKATLSLSFEKVL